MKVKSDFVTNSSSTAYLVFVPDNFDIEKFIGILDGFGDEIEEYICSYKEDYESVVTTEDIQEYKKQFIEGFNKHIKNDEFIYYENSRWFQPARFILSELDLIVYEIDNIGSGSMQDEIVLLSNEKISGKLNSIKSGGWGIRHGGWGHESKE